MKKVRKIEKYMICINKSKVTRSFIESAGNGSPDMYNTLLAIAQDELNMAQVNMRYEGVYEEKNDAYWIQVEIW